jgi:hypothetical protein
MAGEVHIRGLADFQRDLRRIDPELAKGVREGLRDSAQIVAYEAQRRAPVRTGKMRASIKGAASGNRAVVRVTARRASKKYPGGYPYPRRIEYGQGGEPFIGPALEATRPEVERRMGYVLDDVAEIWGD